MLRLRFSLGTLLLAVLLAGSAGSLYVRWGPWVVEKRWDKFEIKDRQDFRITFAAYSPDGRRVAVGLDKMAAIYDLRTGAEAARFVLENGDFVAGGQYTPDGRNILIKGHTKSHLFDAATGVEDRRFLSHQFFNNDPGSIATAYSPDVTKRAEYYPYDEAVLSDGPEFRQRWQIFKHSTAADDTQFEFSADSRLLAVAQYDKKETQIFDLSQKTRIAAIQRAERAVFSPAGDKIAVITQDGVEMWEPQDGTFAKQPGFDVRGQVFSITFSPDASRLLLGTPAGFHLLMVDGTSGAKLGRIGPDFPGNDLHGWGRAPRIAWRPDGGQFMVGDKNTLTFYRRTRPERWWGVFYLPELWTTGILVFALMWRVFERLRKRL